MNNNETFPTEPGTAPVKTKRVRPPKVRRERKAMAPDPERDALKEEYRRSVAKLWQDRLSGTLLERITALAAKLTPADARILAGRLGTTP